MDRRTFNKLTGLLAAGALATPASAQDKPDNWKSGQDSPVHDIDRLIPLSGQDLVLENNRLRIAFDRRSGALIELTAKNTNWRIQRDPKLAESFRVFAPTPERSYNPILGARNHLQSATRSADGRSLTLVWEQLQSEYSGVLDITLTGIVTLDPEALTFEMTVQNNSHQTVASVDWPILGALGRPQGANNLRTVTYTGAYTSHENSVYPRFADDFGFCSVNCPMQLSSGRYTMLYSDREGLYIGKHTQHANDVTKYMLELRPGYADARWLTVPNTDELDGHPVRILSAVQHFPFTGPGESSTLPRIVMHPYQGSWHKGADFYRQWFQSWFKRPPNPAWLDQPHAWQQIEINSSEDDLRTQYKDLPRRALQAAKAGITALQLTGWTKDGQDRGNPSHDIEPRLGTYDDLKEAIARIEKMGVRLILFNKYTFADTSTPWYRSELYRSMAMDPNNVAYISPGFRYQTPEQLANMNTRHFGVACLHSQDWLNICSREFQKSIDLGASGILYDQVDGHGGWDFCFSKDHKHPAPTPLWSGDMRLGEIFRGQVRRSRGEENFLMAGEGLWDLEYQYYSLAYIRLRGEHMPVARYSDPRAQIMIAVTGFEDRDTINCALRYRYIMSFEPFNFKGNVDDYPTTMTYGEKMENFRRKYRSYVWDAEFRDTQDAVVTVNGEPCNTYSVFRCADGRHGAVIMNQGKRPIEATVRFDNGNRAALSWASPEQPDPHPSNGVVRVPARSVVLVMQDATT